VVAVIVVVLAFCSHGWVGCCSCIIISCSFIGSPCFLQSWLVVGIMVASLLLAVSSSFPVSFSAVVTSFPSCVLFPWLCLFPAWLCLFSCSCCCGHRFLLSWLIVVVAPSISDSLSFSCGCFVFVTGIVGCRGCCCCLLHSLLVVTVIEMVAYVSLPVVFIVVSHGSIRICFPQFHLSLFPTLLFVFGLVPADTVFATPYCAWQVLIFHFWSTINSKRINIYN